MAWWGDVKQLIVSVCLSVCLSRSGGRERGGKRSQIWHRESYSDAKMLGHKKMLVYTEVLIVYPLPLALAR